jgi:hypothetical protein
MNDIAKTNIKTKIEKAMHVEVLTNVAAATVLGIKAEYISLIKNPKTWDKCPSSAWETVLAWVNSGQSLTEYAKKHGRIAEAKPVIVTKDDVIVPKQEKIVPEVVKTESKPLIKIKPGVLEKRKEEIAVKERRASRGEMVDMLIEEKESLQAKIDAIDVLLKHYIS